MNIARFAQVRILLCISILALTGCGPVFTIPGGALSGQLRDTPDDWTISQAFETIQIQTNPEDPYSVNIWGVDIAADFYIAASGAADSNWGVKLTEDPAVLLKLGDDLYELNARRIEDTHVIDAVEARYIEKYDLDPDDNFIHSAWVFRLDPRS